MAFSKSFRESQGMRKFEAVHLLAVTLHHDYDVVLSRQRARQIAALLRFDIQEQTQIATAVSEIARNAFLYAGGGKVEFVMIGTRSPQLLEIRISDRGGGIPTLPGILDGSSSPGNGRGILGARRLMDQCTIQTSPAGTTVTLQKSLSRPLPVFTPRSLHQLSDTLARHRPADPLAALQQQNQELLQTLEELRQKQEDLQKLNRELESTNRGLTTLYAELDTQSEHLRQADVMRTRFLSYVTHEFRVPINSILAISRLLLERVDGDLTTEQDRQMTFIRQAAEDLRELVNDLLDLAKIEAGKISVQLAYCDVATLFNALRGILRPLLRDRAVELVFTLPESLPPLCTDESKVAQILRNLISNALKFTHRGSVQVAAALTPDKTAMVFTVSDTGIGIALEDQQRIFEEYVQVEHALQSSSKGTGLGLPLCKKLAALLGGSLTVQSAPGAGATFTVVLPLHHLPEEGRLAEPSL